MIKIKKNVVEIKEDSDISDLEEISENATDERPGVLCDFVLAMLANKTKSISALNKEWKRRKRRSRSQAKAPK